MSDRRWDRPIAEAGHRLPSPTRSIAPFVGLERCTLGRIPAADAIDVHGDAEASSTPLPGWSGRMKHRRTVLRCSHEGITDPASHSIGHGGIALSKVWPSEADAAVALGIAILEACRLPGAHVIWRNV